LTHITAIVITVRTVEGSHPCKYGYVRYSPKPYAHRKVYGHSRIRYGRQPYAQGVIHLEHGVTLADLRVSDLLWKTSPLNPLVDLAEVPHPTYFDLLTLH
jgi:hypothetical protein